MNNIHRFVTLGVRNYKACRVWPSLSTLRVPSSQLVGGVCSMSSNDGGFGKETADSSQYETLRVTFEEGVRVITFNRPDKKNAINEKMFAEVPLALKVASQDPDTVITATTGAGNVYCAGNDRENFRKLTMTDTRDLLIRFFAAFIDFPKPLVALVNGASVGGGATMLPLCDAVYAKESAYILTPFSAINITAEGCSTYTFPLIMGQTKAGEILFFNKKVGAREAETLGLVTEVLPDATFLQDSKHKLLAMARLPIKSLIYTKELMRQPHRDTLHKVNVEECKRVTERLVSAVYPDKKDYDQFVKDNW